MNTTKINSFNVIGISVKTTNENGQSAKDIPELWQKFFSQGIMQKVPNVVDPNIHCLYTDYEGDHTQPYTTLLGMRVDSLDNIPDGMVGMTFAGGSFKKYQFEGNLNDNLVYNAWMDIWKEDNPRAYTVDYEVYDATKTNPEDASVDIFISINS